MDNKQYHKKYYLDNIERERQKCKEYYQANQQRINKQRREERKKRTKFIDDYKLEHGCAICGYNKCAAALDFHHVDGDDKSFRIARGVGSNSMEKVKEEMAKCIVICANCHRELHNGD